MANTKRAREWCFTLNNWTEEEYKHIVDTIDEDIELPNGTTKKYEYYIIGKETGENGTPHLQGFVKFSNARSFNSVRKLFGNRAHVEQCKGNAYQNFTYCSKDGDYIEGGNRPKPKKVGKRNDLTKIKESIAGGSSIRQLLVEDVIINYQQLAFAEKLQKYYEKPRMWRTIVKWYFGPTGTGKTYSAYQEFLAKTDMDNIYVCMDTGQWFEGYDGQEYVIIDDIRGDFMKFHQLLKFLGEYQYRVQTKGGSRQFVAKEIIITAPFPPQYVFKTVEDVSQLLDRIEEIKEFEGESFRKKNKLSKKELKE